MERFFAVDVVAVAVAVADDDAAAVAHSLLLPRRFCCPCLAAVRVDTADSVHLLMPLELVHSKLELPEHAQSTNRASMPRTETRRNQSTSHVAWGMGRGA
jgi:hypothetical protein